MVGYPVYRNQLLVTAAHDAGDVFVKLCLMLRTNQTLAALDGKNDLNVDLCLCVCHSVILSRNCYIGFL